MSRSPPRAARPKDDSGFLSFLKSKATWFVLSIGSIVAGAGTLWGNVDSLKSRFDSYRRDHAYLAQLQHPFPNLLTDQDIAGWGTGRLQLAIFQIDGYLGRLKTAAPWIKVCLTNEYIFPQHHGSQFNERLDLDESYVDRENKALLNRHISSIEYQKTEDTTILRISDPYTRLLARSSLQLLSRFKDSEIAQLEKSQLYLLRNAIFGQQGYPFDTPKLRKYAYRRGWASATSSFQQDKVTPVARCNAFFLQELHSASELGALGRGVLIHQPADPGFPQFLTASVCTCLAGPKIAVECRSSAHASRDEFRDYVDFVLDLDQADADGIEWTFLDEGMVEAADLPSFKDNHERFMSSAVDFNAALQESLETRKLTLAAASESHQGPYWGAKLSFSPASLAMMKRDPAFLRDTSHHICSAVRDALEFAGPFVPRTVDKVAASPTLAPSPFDLLQKPIVFDDLRIKLTQDYVKRHYGIVLQDIEFTPALIVLHWTGTKDLDAAYEAYRPSVLPGSGERDKPKDAEVNTSVHYLVDRDGTVYNLMKDFYIARHITGLDRHAIGIAQVGGPDDPPTASQAVATSRLVRFLAKRYSGIKGLIGSSEYRNFEDSALWEEKDPHYRPDMSGPGDPFLAQVRAELKDLALASKP